MVFLRKEGTKKGRKRDEESVEESVATKCTRSGAAFVGEIFRKAASNRFVAVVAQPQGKVAKVLLTASSEEQHSDNTRSRGSHGHTPGCSLLTPGGRLILASFNTPSNITAPTSGRFFFPSSFDPHCRRRRRRHLLLHCFDIRQIDHAHFSQLEDG